MSNRDIFWHVNKPMLGHGCVEGASYCFDRPEIRIGRLKMKLNYAKFSFVYLLTAFRLNLDADYFCLFFRVFRSRFANVGFSFLGAI